MLRRLRALLRPRPFDDLLIACFPKSGSTYLSKLLQAATGLPEVYLAELGPQREQDLSRRRLKRHVHRSVIQQHMKATKTNVELLEQFGIRPIVQTRSLFDIVPSLHDHYERLQQSLPCGIISTDYLRMSFHERLDYLICGHLPWHFNFYLSWREVADRIEVLPLTYEELTADTAKWLTEILRFYRLPAGPSEIQNAIKQANSANTRRNVGVAGRGLELLLPRHREAISLQAAALHLELDVQGSLAPLPGSGRSPRSIAGAQAA